MTIQFRRIRVLSFVALALAIAIAAVAFWPGRRGPAFAAAARADTPQAATTHDAGATPDAAPISAASPARGEVAIDQRRQQLIGVRTVPVERRRLSREVRTVGLVRYDETRVADVNLKVEAWIRTLDVDFTGQFVRKGQRLFTVYSPELLTTQQEYLLALRMRAQARQAQAPSQIGETSQYTDRLVDSARRRLALWDLPAEEIRAVEQSQQPQSAVVFRSPVSGFVIEKRVVQGMHATAGESLYRITDLSSVWVEADIYERELSSLRRGAPATITLDAYPGARFQGRVIYIYPFVDEKTRTVKARFEFSNRDGRLKPGMYANVELSAPARDGLAVPANAVLDSGSEQIVFVAKGDGYFEPRRVAIGQHLGDTIEIREGVQEGEQVATSATFFLDSESQLRASLQGFESTQTAAPTSHAPAQQPQLQITFRSQPDPPKAGENLLEVEIRTADGKPVDDADVTVAFYMAAMPTMNMPAMRNEAKLPHVGNGVYRGTGTIMMAARWETTVNVTRGGQRLGTKHVTVVAR